MKLKEFMKQVEFCTNGMSDEDKDNMEVCVEMDGGIVPRGITCIESTESILYIVSKAEKRATA